MYALETHSRKRKGRSFQRKNARKESRLFALIVIKKNTSKKKNTMGKSTLLATTLGLLAIGANAGAVDLTESDFDAQVFESGKVRNMHIF